MESRESGIMKVLRAIGNGIMWIFRDEEKDYRPRKGLKDIYQPEGAANDEEKEGEKKVPEYDPWDEIRNLRMNFWMGSWAARKFRPIGEDKLKEKLAEIEKKREEAKKEKGEG